MESCRGPVRGDKHPAVCDRRLVEASDSREMTAADLLLKNTTRARQSPDLGDAFQMQRGIGLAVLGQVLGGSRRVRYDQGVMTGVHGQAEVGQNHEDEPRHYEAPRSMKGHATHDEIILRSLGLQCKVAI